MFPGASIPHFLTYPYEDHCRRRPALTVTFSQALLTLFYSQSYKSFPNSQNACIFLSRAASSTPSVLIYDDDHEDDDHEDDDRNKILLRAAGSMSSTRLQRTVTILPRWRTGRRTSSWAWQAGGSRHRAWAQNPAWVRTSWRERQRILFQHSTNYTRGSL